MTIVLFMAIVYVALYENSMVYSYTTYSPVWQQHDLCIHYMQSCKATVKPMAMLQITLCDNSMVYGYATYSPVLHQYDLDHNYA